MIRHYVAMKLKPEFGESEADELARRLTDLGGVIPIATSCVAERDIGVRENNADVILAVEFASAEDFQAYLVHPAHQAIVADYVTPWVGERLEIQTSSSRACWDYT